MFGIGVDDEVFLRLHEERHAQELFQLVEKNRAHLRPWLPWVGATKSSEDTRRFIRQLFLRLADGKEYGFGVLYRGELVGAIGLSVVSDAGEAEVGYWLSEESQGRGIVSRATRALVLFSFVDLGLNRVVITCAAENARSRAVPERLASRWRQRSASGRWKARTKSSIRSFGRDGRPTGREGSGMICTDPQAHKRRAPEALASPISRLKSL